MSEWVYLLTTTTNSPSQTTLCDSSEDLAAYTLTVKTPSYDSYNPNSYQSSGSGRCGTPGQLSGLRFTFSSTELPSIPYNELVEVAFTVSGSALCSEYVDDVELMMIMSTCEMPSSNSSEVFQYIMRDAEGSRYGTSVCDL